MRRSAGSHAAPCDSGRCPGTDSLIPSSRLMRGWGNEIAGNMLAHQLVVADVGIQCPNQIVAITPGIGNRRITFAAVRLGVAKPIHPMPRPTLAKSRRRQKSIDQSLVGIRRRVLQKGFNLIRRRRQTGQHKRNSTGKRAAIGLSVPASVRPLSSAPPGNDRPEWKNFQPQSAVPST